MTTDALWTRFTRCWRELMRRYCSTCRVFVEPDVRFYPLHYHGNYFD